MAIDPRIRARRVQIRRAEGRRRLRFLLLALGLVALAIAAWGLTRSPLLDLDHVRVDGVTGADAAAVLDVAALETGTAMFDLDLGSAETAVGELAWVKSASVEREWPGTVRITVTLRVGVVVLADADSRWVVDDEGVVIGPADDDSGLPVVAWTVTEPVGGAERDALPAIAVARAIPEDLRRWVDAVTMQPRVGDGPVVLGLDLVGAARVELGGPDLVEDKLAGVRAVLQGADLACIDVIDVTVADLTTVTRDPVCDGTDDEPADG